MPHSTFNDYPDSDNGMNEDGSLSDVAIMGVRYDGGNTTQAGQRSAPWHIRNSGYWEDGDLYDWGLRQDLNVSVVDVGDVEGSWGVPTDTMVEIYGYASQVICNTDFLVVLGGDDSITKPCVDAAAFKADSRQIHLVHLDAHTDMWEKTALAPYGDHGTWVRDLQDEQTSVSMVTGVGIRALGPRAKIEAKSHGYTNLFPARTMHMIDGWMQTLSQRVANNGPAWLAIDMDVFDPSVAPGVSNPEPFGLLSHQVQQIVRACASMPDVMGMSITETLPAKDINGMTSLLANRLVIESLFARSALKQSY